MWARQPRQTSDLRSAGLSLDGTAETMPEGSSSMSLNATVSLTCTGTGIASIVMGHGLRIKDTLCKLNSVRKDT